MPRLAGYTKVAALAALAAGLAAQKPESPATEIAAYVKKSAAELKPGEKIFIAAAKKLPDGTLEAPNVSFGDYAVWR